MAEPVILVTGAAGQIGHELVRTLAPLGRVVAPPRRDLDLADPAGVRRTVRQARPTLIVNAAAYTDVERAEDEPELARAVNATAPGVLAAEAVALGALLVHYSTDYVFDGAAREPYPEDAPTRPLGVYGRTKLEGEQAVAAAGGPHLILRTAWVYGNRGRNFLNTMVRLSAGEAPLRVVHDQVGPPTWSRLIAEATAQALARLKTGDRFELPAEAAGIHHLTAAGSTSWHGFASAIMAGLAGAGGTLRPVEAIATADRPSRAHRPAYSVLRTDRFAECFGLRLPDWETQLGLCLADRS
jgi:dTDP-4-dehydrorhamnose reductase